MTNTYDKDSIESLDPRSHVQLRSGMYIGDNSNPNQLLTEIFSNALDEYNIGHGKKITVTISKRTKECTVEDEGQGFLVNQIRDDGKTILEAAFSVINTSGKFKDDGVYEGSSLGTNGLGGKLTNFLSSNFYVTTYRNNRFESIKFVNGLFEGRQVGEVDHPNGTTVRYTPDPKYFKSAVTDVSYFKKFFSDMCCLCPGLIIELITDDSVEIIVKEGINDFVTDRAKSKVELISNRFLINEPKFMLGMTFTSKDNAEIIPYVNYGLTNGGPHITALKSAITRTLNNWARENGLLKEKEKNLDGNSIQEGMLLVCNITSTGVAYDAQTKGRVTSIDTSFIDTFNEQLEIWLDNNPEDAKIIIEKALLARKASEAAKKAREAVKKKEAKKDKVFKLPTTLTDCWTKDRSKAELLICEGKSSASGLVAARDSETQAVYGVRGKCLSVLKTTPAKILANQEINNLIQALGLECNQKTAKLVYDASHLRYGKIITCADADFDGYAIENLLFNILWFLCPELIINGHVYSAVPPLFRITTKNNEYIYCKGEKELNEYKEKNEGKIKFIGRMKGLGEQDSNELSECLLEPETRNILQLQVSDVKETDKLFNDLYGKQVEPRVKFLLEHSEEAHIE